MNKNNKFMDIYFLLLLIEIFSVTTFMFLGLKEITLLDYSLYGVFFIILYVSYFTNLIIGLLTSAFFIFFYGSYIIYESIYSGISNGIMRYIWIGIFPLTAFISGKFGEKTSTLISYCKEAEHHIMNFVTVDETTGLSNAKEFYEDLDAEISRAKRHRFDLSAMIIEIQYFEELITIYGQSTTKNIIKILANTITKVIRDEDKIYKLNASMFSIILPNTNISGAKVLKNRLKTELQNIVINKEKDTTNYKFDTKVGILQYHEKISNGVAFKNLMEKELEYDV